MRKWLGGNWTAKLICFFVAVFLWVFIMNEQNPLVESSYELPVEVTHLNTSLVALDAPQSVHVKLRMQRNTMLQLRESDMKAVLDMTDANIGKNENMMLQLILPPGAEVMEQKPLNFTVNVDEMASKIIQVTAKVTDDPANDHGGAVTAITPNVVTITGPSSLVSQVKTAQTVIHTAGRKADFDIVAAVALYDAQGNKVDGVTLAPENVLVKMKLTPLRVEKTLPLAVQTSGAPASGWRVDAIEIKPREVTLAGEKSQLDALSAWQLPAISVSGEAGEVIRQVEIPVPSNGTATPETAMVRVILKEE